MEKAAELKEAILFLVRAETNSILAASDTGHKEFTAAMIAHREEVANSRMMISTAASESGKKLLEGFEVAIAKLNEYQEETRQAWR